MITGSAFPISLHPDWLLPVDGADHSVCSNPGTPNKAFGATWQTLLTGVRLRLQRMLPFHERFNSSNKNIYG